jgi:hypothetical protein
MSREDTVPPASPKADKGAGTKPDATAEAAADGDSRLSDELRNIAAQGGEAMDALQRTLEAAHDLLMAEAALAREATLRIAALVLTACVLLLGGWLCLMAALAVWLRSVGLSWMVAVAAVAAISLVLGALALWRAARLAPLLGFPRSRRQLQQQGQAM